MNRTLRVLLVLICFVLGVLLMYLPWSDAWERNLFLNPYPWLNAVLKNSWVRGGITGLGVLDIVIAAGMIRRRSSPATVATRS